MEVIKVFVQSIAQSQDGKKTFINDAEETLHIGWTNKLKGINAGNNIVVAGEWKTSQKGNAYFNIDHRVTKESDEGQGDTAQQTEPQELPYAKHPLTLALEWGIAKMQSGESFHIYAILMVAEIFELFLRGHKEEALTKAKEASIKKKETE